jgi:hypothetical protein
MSTTDTATLFLQTTRDGSWIGNANYAPAAATLVEGGADPDVVIRRLAARLAGLQTTPDRVKLVRLNPDGTREEREAPLTELRATS